MARPAAAVLAVVALAVVLAMDAAPRAEAGQNCICECMKLCIRTRIPSMDRQCSGKCRENACTKSCEEACTLKGYPRLPKEGISICELEPLTTDETHMLH
ncbi:hypothetical protein C2845_PM08G23420 [Panicum miliaceum]|uniref:Uncharacterized protein n=1 Tax=Panicum miliaceum TaxID=4540 RepID=A0A3L6R026_PANMI|nr:hypothetical protein C2845_PM08G23420 [Panicum miliaceum]